MTDNLNHLTSRLKRDIDQMPPSLQAAAKYIIDRPADFGLNPIRVSADKIGVSSNVLVRLARRMGFDGFEAFRAPFRLALVTDREYEIGTSFQRLAPETAQSKFAQNAQNVVARSLRLMSPEQAHRVTDHIMSSKRCFVTATRASYALAYYFSYVGRMAHPGLQLIPKHIGSAVDDLLDADQSDCLLAITVEPYSADTIQSVRFAQNAGCRIVLISDSDVIAPGLRPDEIFVVSTRSLHLFSSYAGAMAVLECLLAHLFNAAGPDAIQRLEAYQKAREDTGAYWTPKTLPKIRRP